MKTCEVCVLIDWESTLEGYPGEKIRADRPLKHINIDSLSSSVVSIEGYFHAVVMVDCHTYMQLHALNYMTSTYPLHDITCNGTFNSRRLHNHYIESHMN